MWRDRLGDNIEAGRPALGLYIESVQMVELAAHMGFDWFQIDQMFTANDWSRTDELIRAGEAYGITPAVRVASHPWSGNDSRLVVDVARAFAIGAKYVIVSNSGVDEIRSCAAVAGDWHRKAETIHPFGGFDEWDPGIKKMAKQSYLVPQPETLGALKDIPETLEMPEVKLLFIAMTDSSKQLRGSNKPDFYDKRLWEIVDGAVAQARKSGKAIGANTSYAYDLKELSKRTVMLHERGIQMIMIQGATFLFQVAIGEFLRETRRAMKVV